MTGRRIRVPSPKCRSCGSPIHKRELDESWCEGCEDFYCVRDFVCEPVDHRQGELFR